MAVFEGLSTLRFLLDTETDHKSPGDEELMSQVRELFEILFLLMLKAGSGTLTSNPPDDTTGFLIDTGAGFTNDQHNDRTVVMLDGDDKLGFYDITDTEAANNRIECSGENFYAKGIRSEDKYLILYDVINPTHGHDHDGINSKSAVLADDVITQAKMANSAIGQAQLKSTTQSQNSAIGDGLAVKFDLTGGTYCFFPQTYGSTAAITMGNKNVIGGQGNHTSYATSVWLSNDDAAVTRTGYVQQRYVQASGEVHWIFIKRDKATKDVIAVSACWDHPCFGCGGKPVLKWHPFGQFDPDTEEIICINSSKAEVKAMQEATEVEAEDQPDRDLTDVIIEDYEIDELSTPEWPKEEVTVALPPDWNEAWLSGRKVTPVKKVISKPEGVMVRRLRKR